MGNFFLEEEGRGKREEGEKNIEFLARDGGVFFMRFGESRLLDDR